MCYVLPRYKNLGSKSNTYQLVLMTSYFEIVSHSSPPADNEFVE